MGLHLRQPLVVPRLGTLDASPPGDDGRPFTTQAAGGCAGRPAVRAGASRRGPDATLRSHLVAAGVAAPLVALVVRHGRVPERSLALTLPADPAAAHRLTWVLPPDLGMLDIAALAAVDGAPL